MISLAREVRISATIGQPSLGLYGYGPAGSFVRVTGVGVSDMVTADGKGYFVFENIYTPTLFYPELCVQAIDGAKRVTQPSCIPPMPIGALRFNVGPIFLSPTFSIGGAVASGKTVPDAEVDVYLADKIKSFYIPVYKTLSDASGYFEFSLPIETESEFRIFLASVIGGFPSAKSNTINYKVQSAFTIYWQESQSIFETFRTPIIIVLELFVIAVLAFGLLRTRRRRN